MYKLEMVFKQENHEVLLKKQFTQLIQENPKIESPMLYFTGPSYLPFLLMMKTLSGSKKNTYRLEMVFNRENH